MPRNFFRRIESCFPILDEKVRVRLEQEILATSLADNVKAWKLHPDGTWRRRNRSEPLVRSQERFIEIARSESVRIGPYDEVISKPSSARRKAKRQKKKEKSKT